MGSANRPSTCNFVTYWVILSLCLACIGCSSKTDQDEKQDEMAPSPTASAQRTQVSLEQQVQALKQENAELKRTLAESLTLKEQVQKLRQQNDELKRVLTDALGKAEKAKPAEPEGEELEKAVAAAVDTEQPIVSNEKTDAMVAEFESAGSTEEKLKFLRSLGRLAAGQDSSVIGVVRRALSDPDPEVGRAAVKLLAGYRKPGILPVVEQALSSEDQQIRMRALVPLRGINSPEADRLLVQALSDPSKDVRYAALVMTGEKSDATKLSVLSTGITSPHEDVKYAAVSILGGTGDPAVVDVLLEGLNDSNPDFRNAVNAILRLLINQDFDTYDEAQAWWAKNRNSYDNDLFETEPN